MTPEVQQVAQEVGVAASLGLDWKLFIAQLVNFSVILFIVWKWVYNPLAKAMDDRANKIEQGIKDAEEGTQLKQTAEEEKQKLIVEARKQSKEIVEKAEADAKIRQDDMITKAKDEVQRVVTEGKQRLRDEQDVMIQDAKARVAELVVAATEKVLREKVDAGKDAGLVRAAIEEADKR
ncbi:MAG: F0F1 ATP synthase subunit B [Patescibacteria group bacterium]|nr:F0F1 ATP synthase subunit B [Patescibacteria group bacterium]